MRCYWLTIAVIVGGCGRIGFDLLDPGDTLPPVDDCTPVTTALGVGAGGNYTCVNAPGGLRCWGDGSEGQMGDGTRTSRIDPYFLPLGNVIAFATGAAHACAVVGNALYCWGRNESGQLGIGNLVQQTSPTAVSNAPASIAGVAAGGMNTCVWTDAGELWCWGRYPGVNTQSNQPVHVLGVPPIIDAALSSLDAVLSATHACAVGRDGTVWCWGTNDKGQLGDNTTTLTMVPVQTVGLSTAIHVALASKASCAIVAGGDVYCWGINDTGQLGNGTRTDSLIPVKASIADAVEIAAKADTFCVRKSDRTVWCWGANSDGQAGNADLRSSDVPRQVAVPFAQAISVGVSHACAISTQGTLWCWGSDRVGERGDDATIDRTALFETGMNASQFASGEDFTCAVPAGVAGQPLRCWGVNSSGQLGDGTKIAHSTPAPAMIDQVINVEAGNASACAIRSDRTAWCWGDNDAENVAMGAAHPQTTPLAISLPQNVNYIAPATSSTCAVLSDSTTWCWGANNEGQSALPNNMMGPLPPTNSNFPALSYVDAGAAHTCGLATAAAYCAGRGNELQIGEPDRTTDAYTPYMIGIANISNIQAGGLFTCALAASGMYCWGDNRRGQIGIDTTKNANPTLVGLSGVTAFAAGPHHVCAVNNLAEWSCWGDNSAGQLGDGTTTTHLSPVRAPLFDGATKLTLGRTHTCMNGTAGLRCIGSFTWGPIGSPQPVTPTAANFSCPR
ncbi:MAG TPA: hypothetical protein VMZ53_19545 [Kofleriaceae bacterium]|nr:hypothetical protein [Kofleriaceae bacterium]